MEAHLNLLRAADGRHPVYDGGSLDLPGSVEVFKSALYDVSLALPGRHPLLQQSALALLTRRHQLLISRAGTGKSLYGESIFAHFEGSLFKAQFTQGTRLETVLGGLDLELFHQGKLWHNTSHSLITADFAYLDEFMNANDLVLEALLGILHERHFSQGEQQEDAKLHTALAMTNHVKFSQIAEPILDRFMFKATIDHHADALHDLLIDFAYESHHGRVTHVGHPIPMEMLQMLSGIVQGQDPDNHIDATHAMLFLKNQVIDAYQALCDQERVGKRDPATGREAAELYISPRTRAASRDALNASALLHHRRAVTTEDLFALRFVLTTVDGTERVPFPPTEDAFAQAVHTVIGGYSAADLGVVDELGTIAQNFQWFTHGTPLEAQGANRGIVRLFLSLIGRTSWKDVTYETFAEALRGARIDHPRVNALREDLLEEVLSYARNEG